MRNLRKLGWLLLLATPQIVSAQAVPRPEYPRPQLVRDAWLNLNGAWQFQFDPKDIGVDDQWFRAEAKFDRNIVVPFGWESKLSGIQDKSGQKIGWYRRAAEIPADWNGKRVRLNFGAVDWEARVWVNGKEVGHHEGGYTPFSCDISEFAKPGSTATIVVRAFDPTDKALPTGKQVFWYTPTSGIWQTVWLEATPATSIQSLKLTPQLGPEGWSVAAAVSVHQMQPATGNHRIRFRSQDRTIPRLDTRALLIGKDFFHKSSGLTTANQSLPIREPRLWSPEDPYLYELDIELADDNGIVDTVHTYFGLRTIARGKVGDRPYESILLNGKPIYLRGALDQSFNPDGVYTAPTDEFLRKDMELAKRVGLNFLRIHIKPEEPRRLYWADKLGVLIMQDMPNTWIFSEPGKRAWELTMRQTMERDCNHPSVFAWCLFNETWGLDKPRDAKGRTYRDNPERQEWVEAMFKIAKSLDGSRLIEDMSPDKRDHICGDINSWHFYIDNYDKARTHIEEVVRNTFPGSPFNYVAGRKQDAAPLINSEYGSVSAGGGDRDVSWGFRYLTTQLRRHEKIQGYIYTELTDIEWEHNGFANYDRSPKQFGYDGFLAGMTPADLQGADFVGFDAPPVMEVPTGVDFQIPVFVSQFADHRRSLALRWAVVGFDDMGNAVQTRPVVASTKSEFARVTAQPPLVVRLPTNRPFVGAVTLELIDEGGRRVAGNFVNVIARPKRPQGQAVSPRVEWLAPNKAALRFAPDDFAQADGGGTDQGVGKGKFFGHGACRVDYSLRLPRAVAAAEPMAIEFLLEMASKADKERLDWPARTNKMDYPQTDRHGFESLVELLVDGKSVATVRTKDDPADARGVLSHAAYFHHGSYGELHRIKLNVDNHPEAMAALKAGEPLQIAFRVNEGSLGNGLAIFGERTGRFPIDPTLIVTTRKLLPNQLGDPMKPLTTKTASAASVKGQ